MIACLEEGRRVGGLRSDSHFLGGFDIIWGWWRPFRWRAANVVLETALSPCYSGPGTA